jgi:hypothetical protein
MPPLTPVQPACQRSGKERRWVDGVALRIDPGNTNFIFNLIKVCEFGTVVKKNK